MTLMDVSQSNSKTRACLVWFADRPDYIRGYDDVEFKEAGQMISSERLQPQTFETLFSNLGLNEAILLDKMTPGKRRDLKIAQNRGWVVVSGNELADINRFHSLHCKFCGSKQIHPPLDAYILGRNQQHCFAAFVLNPMGTPICWNFYVLSPPFVRLWYAGSDFAFRNNDRGYAATLLHWQMMLYFQASNFKVYDWGGACTDPSSATFGITLFKASFGGTPEIRYNYRFPQRRGLLRRACQTISTRLGF